MEVYVYMRENQQGSLVDVPASRVVEVGGKLWNLPKPFIFLIVFPFLFTKNKNDFFSVS